MRTKFTLCILLIIWVGCQKEMVNETSIRPDVATTLPSNQITSPLQKLMASNQFKQAQTSLNAITLQFHTNLWTPTLVAQANAYGATATQPQQVIKWLSILKVDTNVYKVNALIFANAVKTYNLANQTTSKVWQDAFAIIPPTFTPYLTPMCKAKAIAIFVVESGVCIGLGSVPIGGAYLAGLCTNGAIAHLVTELFECAKKDKEAEGTPSPNSWLYVPAPVRFTKLDLKDTTWQIHP